ncbi:glyoxylase-like metal-dependent hydrolase (beta-lactamase superfamily II) [Evansella vedderi]|uniref:Glyoxylase-like metal-dependent hydrolase (Beta-lactamase superfamily II) n=1 Tax=Evansella vedderi TaxID=38282 RepID=A0ABT9ZTB9_9BACI|nr:MBL fold metallo-hydrolase [Evansella vedderi]MDQ0253961.1 glyoxylase-like metal-dependent hydrolase (beta-lactamase superfamily II) [Evansella vedderi]
MTSTMEQLTKNIYQMTVPTPFLVGPVNTYLIEGDALTLVDTGPKTEEAYDVLKGHLKEKKLQFEDIEVVILTHHHPDHIGLLEEFLPNAKVYAHPKVKPWISKERDFFNTLHSFYQALYTSHGVPADLVKAIEKRKRGYLNFSANGYVDKELKEGDMIEGLPDWTVLETPGHAQSHISLYRELDGVMLAGDHLIEHISSNAIIEGPYPGEKDRPKTLLQYRDSLKKCLMAKVAYAGHGVAITDPKSLIDSRLRDQDRKAVQFKELMRDEIVTCFELCKRKYGHIYQQQPDLTFSETLGHLDLLESRGEIKQLEQDRIVKYKVI